MELPAPAQALAAQKAYATRIRTMTEEHLAQRKAERDTLVERASAVLTAAGYPAAVKDSRGYVLSSGWAVRGTGDGHVFVNAEPEVLTSAQGEELQASPDFAARQLLVDRHSEDRMWWVRAQLDSYRSTLCAANWTVQLFDSRSEWNICLHAKPSSEENSRAEQVS
ncbi:hypothetical protein [Streptomyces mirabilis]|uniref:hypothetical protein n=1 Tax=Streptomyces mirabilis TaxID=68239 RepID=UPI0036A00CC8